MGDTASLRGVCVWVIVSGGCDIRAFGTSAVDAWRNFFNKTNTLETLDGLSQTLGHDDFRCVACRLVPDDDAAWNAAAAESSDLAVGGRLATGRRAAIWGMIDG